VQKLFSSAKQTAYSMVQKTQNCNCRNSKQHEK